MLSTCAQEHVSQRSTSDIILLELPTLVLDTGFLTGLECTKKLGWLVSNLEETVLWTTKPSCS